MQIASKKPKFYIYALAGLFLLQFIFVNPIGEFALNDDWVHTDVLKHWIDTGEFRMPPYAGPTFYVPILYGAGLTKIFGFSFTLLRISTLILALATFILFYKFLMRVSDKPTLNFALTLALWFNPIFYNMTFTFMTEVPALLLIISAIYAYYLGFTKNKPSWLFWGSVFSVLGMFTRQTNIIVMAAAGLYALTQLRYIRFRDVLWSFGIPGLIGISTYFSLSKNNLLPPGIEFHYLKSADAVLEHSAWWLIFTFAYIGFFVLPIAFGWIIKNFKKILSPKVFAYPLFVVVIALYVKYRYGFQFPYVLNIINTYGLGPMQGVLNGMLKPMFASRIWAILTIFIAASAGWLVYIVQTRRQSKIKEMFEDMWNKLLDVLHLNARPVIPGDKTKFILLFVLLFTIPILLFDSFDRYFLPIYIGVAILISKKIQENELSMVAVYAGILVYAVFSISQTAFYINWNKARWDMANTILAESGLKAENVDAGYEWDGWHTYWTAHEAQQAGAVGPWGAPWWLTHLFVNNTQDYIVSFSPIPPYNVVKEVNIKGWNPNDTLYLLEKPEELRK